MILEQKDPFPGFSTDEMSFSTYATKYDLLLITNILLKIHSNFIKQKTEISIYSRVMKNNNQMALRITSLIIKQYHYLIQHERKFFGLFVCVYVF